MRRSHTGRGSVPPRERAARAVARASFALLAGLSRLLPHGAMLRLAAGASRAVWRLFPGVRAGLLKNAACILGPPSSPAERAAFGRRVLEGFSRFLVEILAPPAAVPAQDLEESTVGRERFEAALSAGKGVIAVTLHLGNYELASQAIARLRPGVAVVYNRDPIGLVEALRSRRRREARLDEVVIDDSVFFGVEVLRRLRRGDAILLSGDQVAARDGERFPFLHGVAPFSLWPARLSLASGAPLLPAFNVRGPDGRYRLHLEPPIFPAEGRSPVEMTREILGVFERYLRAHGDQWLMIRSFWVDAGGPWTQDAARPVR